MSASVDGSGATLAQKYQEKAQARKRGAGSRQPKFRGFSLAKATDKDQINGEDDTAEENATETAITATATRTEVRVTKTNGTNTTTRNQIVPATKSNGTSGFNEHFQGRMQARLRGTGSHQTGFRGFSITAEPRSAEARPERRRSTRNSSAITPEPATDVASGSIAGNQTSESTTSFSSRRPRPTPDTHLVPNTPSSTRTRSASRLSGVSPSFKIAWGKNATYLTTEPFNESELIKSKLPSQPKPQTKTRKEKTPRDPEPEEESLVDMDTGALDENFDNNYREPTPPSPPPLPKESAPEKAPRPAPKATKRKPDSTGSSSQKPVVAAAAPVAKKRRLIREEEDEEEVDENVDPELDTRKKQAKEAVVNSSANESSSATSRKSKDAPGKTKEKNKASRESRRVDGTDSSSAAATSTTTTTASLRRGQRPLRQTTLMQLGSITSKRQDNNVTLKEAPSTSRATEDVDTDGSDSDFMKPAAQASKTNAFTALSSAGVTTKKKKKASSSSSASADNRKGPSDQTVKTYKQLQIQCLKYWGPSVPVSRPAAVSNQEIAKQLPVLGERPAANTSAAGASAATAALAAASAAAPRKTVQSILQIDQAPLSEMDVIAEAVRGVVDKFIDQLEDRTMAKELLTLRAELESVLIEQVDMLDDHSVLRASVKKAAALKKELRSRLLETQRQRQRTRQELKRVRSSFEREERSRRRLEETHKFLTDLEVLRDEVVGSDPEDDADDEAGDDPEDVKTGLQSLLATVGERYAGTKSGTSSSSSKDSSPGVLGALKEFNSLLESLERSARDMPLVSHSQQATSTRTLGFDTAGNNSSDDSDF